MSAMRIAALLVAALTLQGCVAAAATGAVIGVTAATAGAAIGAGGALVGAGVDAVTTSDEETLRKERRDCERRVRRGSNEDCSVYRPR